MLIGKQWPYNNRSGNLPFKGFSWLEVIACGKLGLHNNESRFVSILRMLPRLAGGILIKHDGIFIDGIEGRRYCRVIQLYTSKFSS